MDWSHSYWKYAELVNGRLAMIGIIILLIKLKISSKNPKYYRRHLIIIDEYDIIILM